MSSSSAELRKVFLLLLISTCLALPSHVFMHAGCLFFNVLQDEDDPTIVCFTEGVPTAPSFHFPFVLHPTSRCPP